MKVESEDKFRNHLLAKARSFGAEVDLKRIFARYDRLLNQSRNSQEHEAIKAMALIEIHRFFGCTEALVANGQELLPPLKK